MKGFLVKIFTSANLNRTAAFFSFIWFGMVATHGARFTRMWFEEDKLSSTELVLMAILGVILFILLMYFSGAIAKLPSLQFWSIIFASIFLSKALWFIYVPTQPVSDFLTYHQAAQSVAQGEGIGAQIGGAVNGWIWPIFLGGIYAVFGSSIVVAKIVCLILDLLAVGLLYLFSKNLLGETQARFTLIFYGLWPGQLFFTTVLGTEHITLVLVLAGLIFATGLLNGSKHVWRNGLFAGLFLALGILSRPAAVAFVVAIALVLLVEAFANWRKVIPFGVLCAALLFSFLIYNSALKSFNNENTPDVKRSFALNFLFGSNQKWKGVWNIADDRLGLRNNSQEGYLELLRVSIERYRSLRVYPLVRFFVDKGYIFWTQPDYGFHFSAQQTAPEFSIQNLPKLLRISLVKSQHYYQIILLIIASLSAYITYFKGSKSGLAVVYLSLLFATAIHMILVTGSRYQYIFVPMLMVAAASGVGGGIASRLRRPHTQRADILPHPNDTPEAVHTRARQNHWDFVAKSFDIKDTWGEFYHQRLREIYSFLVAPGLRVLELGCGQGDLLSALKPSYGVGVDFSGEMISRALQRHPELKFIEAGVSSLDLQETFDVIILSDLVNDLWDVQSVLDRIACHCTPHTRIIFNFYSRVWEPFLKLGSFLGLSRPNLEQNWLTVEDVTNLLNLAGFEAMRSWQEVLSPLPFPIVDWILNRVMVKIWPFNLLAISNFIVARMAPHPRPDIPKPLVSVVIPARNEAGNVKAIFERVPEMGAGTELIFVEGHSRDNTYEEIEKGVRENSSRRCMLLKQAGQGKGDAVRLGFSKASGEILMILDADLTVPPEDLPRFYSALIQGKGEIINGVRLVYPMERSSMRFFNFLGNKFFSLAFSWLLGQPIKDTLCGTKVLWKRDYEILAANRAYFGNFDPFGDFDLLFGAARINLKMVDLPIHYQERKYGTTNIHRWKHGWLLLKMLVLATIRIKFI